MITPEPPPYLVAFLWHLKREWLTPGGCDTIEAHAAASTFLGDLEAIDPHTLASARELAARLTGDVMPGDTFGRDNASVGEGEQ